MTDNEIVKYLESTIRRYKDATHHVSCIVDINMLKAALDLINRQNAEIEKLNVELVGMRGACESYKMHYNNAQAEIERLKLECYKLYPKGGAYSMQVEASDRLKHQIESEARKEFAERFAKELSKFDMSTVGLPDYDRGYKDCMMAVEDTIDNLLEEMEEKKNGKENE